MKQKIIVLIISGLMILQLAAQKTKCVIKTTEGNITVELYQDKAPVTVANFLGYVDARLYDSSTFFRSVRMNNQPKDAIKIEVIQGGNVDSTKVFPPIPLETTSQTRLRHLNGTISMARAGPNTATSSFFICIKDQPSLDYGGMRNKDGQGFAAFGKVIKGMNVVKKIQNMFPQQGQYFNPPAVILSIRRK